MKTIKLILKLAFIFNGIIYASERGKQIDQQIECLYAHGFGADSRELDQVKSDGLIPYTHGQAFNGPEVIMDSLFPDVNNLSYGQEKDMQVLQDAMQQIQKSIVAIGRDKGAAAWINLASQLINDTQLKALVLMSPYAHADNMLYGPAFMKFIPFGDLIYKKIRMHFSSYNPDGLQPLTSIAHIRNKHLPILIVDSKKSLPYLVSKDRDAYVLYKEFLDQGFDNVYMIDLKEIDLHMQKYTLACVVNTFYKQFGLLFYQQLDTSTMDSYKPNADLIKNKIKPNYFELYGPSVVKMMMVLYLAYILISNVLNVLEHERIAIQEY